ncbi:MAG: glycosyltransferase, partial [Firmicutes bacterium]|nr:glycosyltransferase [Bacillota bacterium]
CSFPDFCADNEIFMGLSVDEIDSVFMHFDPKYTVMPTGVGFCMGMNRNVIEKIGALDAETFYKGYGEENDWCQRAIRAGFKNVQVENLFVYHKHGASFPSEDKKRYIERNLKLINERYPNYGPDVEKYIKADPVRPYREYAKLLLMPKKVNKNAVIFDHAWGGGANSYSKRRINNEISKGNGVINVIFEGSGMYAKYITAFGETGFALDGYAALDKYIDIVGNVDHIVINELVSCDDIYPALEYILALKYRLGAKLYMLGHDFYSCCPSLYLINKDGKHCFKPETSICEGCIGENGDSFNKKCTSITTWRKNWGSFLSCCDEITVFSENSKGYFTHFYPELKNIKVLPHTVDYIPKIPPYPTDKDRLTIGILGNFMRTKGSRVVIGMQEIIDKKHLPVDIVVIGENLDTVSHSSLKVLGRYKPADIPDIFRENKIDIVFIASVWPETFSYTTQEVINMDVPVACFDIGAPAERISKYDKGLIIPEMTAEAALKAISEYTKKGGAENG